MTLTPMQFLCVVVNSQMLRTLLCTLARVFYLVPQVMELPADEVVCNGNTGHRPEIEGLFTEIKRLREDINNLSEKFGQFVQDFKQESKTNSRSAAGSPTLQVIPFAKIAFRYFVLIFETLVFC